MNNPEPVIGQIWREVDSRFVRFVRVKAVLSGDRGIGIQTATENGKGGWMDKPRSRFSWSDRARFNGKHQGYEFHCDGFTGEQS